MSNGLEFKFHGVYIGITFVFLINKISHQVLYVSSLCVCPLITINHDSSMKSIHFVLWALFCSSFIDVQASSASSQTSRRGYLATWQSNRSLVGRYIELLWRRCYEPWRTPSDGARLYWIYRLICRFCLFSALGSFLLACLFLVCFLFASCLFLVCLIVEAVE